MHIRTAQTEDLLQIASIGKRSFLAAFLNEGNKEEVIAYVHQVYDPSALKRRFSDAENSFLVAEEEKDVVGFAELNHEKPGHGLSSASLKLERLYLDPDCIGKGYGAALMKECFSRCKEQKSEFLWLQVLRSNKQAITFYEHWGFKEFNRSPAKFKADNELDLWLWSRS